MLLPSRLLKMRSLARSLGRRAATAGLVTMVGVVGQRGRRVTLNLRTTQSGGLGNGGLPPSGPTLLPEAADCLNVESDVDLGCLVNKLKLLNRVTSITRNATAISLGWGWHWPWLWDVWRPWCWACSRGCRCGSTWQKYRI